MPKTMPKGRPMKAGKSGNAKGSNAKTRVRTAAKRVSKLDPKLLSPDDIARQFLITMAGGPEIERLAANPTGNDYKTALARAWTIVAQTGDLDGLDSFMDRVIGKPRAQVALTGATGGAVDVTYARRELSVEEKLARVAELSLARGLALGD